MIPQIAPGATKSHEDYHEMAVIPSVVEESCFCLSWALRFLDYVRKLSSLGMTGIGALTRFLLSNGSLGIMGGPTE